MKFTNEPWGKEVSCVFRCCILTLAFGHPQIFTPCINGSIWDKNARMLVILYLVPPAISAFYPLFISFSKMNMEHKDKSTLDLMQCG